MELPARPSAASFDGRRAEMDARKAGLAGMVEKGVVAEESSADDRRLLMAPRRAMFGRGGGN